MSQVESMKLGKQRLNQSGRLFSGNKIQREWPVALKQANVFSTKLELQIYLFIASL